MDEELKKALNDSGKSLLDWANQSGAFVKEQAPLYVQELLAWEFWSAVMGAALGLAMILTGLGLLWKYGKRLMDYGKQNRYDPGPELLLGVFAGLVVLGLIPTCANTWSAVKVKVAPRVVIVEKLRGMIR